MPHKGRPSLSKTGEPSVPVNVRLTPSRFDELYRLAKLMSEATDRDVSIAQAVRMKIAPPVDESVFGPDDGRPPFDARVVSAGVEYMNYIRSCERAEWIEIVQELLSYLDLVVSSTSSEDFERMKRVLADAIHAKRMDLGYFRFQVPKNPDIKMLAALYPDLASIAYISESPVDSKWPWFRYAVENTDD